MPKFVQMPSESSKQAVMQFCSGDVGSAKKVGRAQNPLHHLAEE